MSRQRAPRGDYPPEWIRQARIGKPPLGEAWLDAVSTTAGGAVLLRLWRSLPDANERELEFALNPAPGTQSEAERRIRALRSALAAIERNHPALSDVSWSELMAVPAQLRASGTAVIGALETARALSGGALRGAPAATVETVGPRLQRRRDDVANAYGRHRKATGEAPTQAELAAELPLSDRQLRTWVTEDPWLERYVPVRRRESKASG